MNRSTIRRRLKKIMTVCMLGVGALAFLLLRLCYDFAYGGASWERFGLACIVAAFLYGFGWAGMTVYGWLYVRETEESERRNEHERQNGL